MTQPERLIVFARFPEAGQVKTRLIPALGADRAAQLQAALTHATLDVAGQYCSGRPCEQQVQFAGGDAARMGRLFGVDRQYEAQVGNGLGERLEHAVSASFHSGVQRLVVIGTDCPELDSCRLNDAFAALTHSDVVLGPALDGGYYLIGMRTPRVELFRGIDWGTERVLQQTLTIARRLGIRVHRLQPLSDLDHAEDLVACRRRGGACSDLLAQTSPGRLSIIVPTLNEARTIEQCLAPIVSLPNVEVLVADGGSTDATTGIASRMGAHIVPARPGRGRQMNAAAALASGEVLLFLHADTALPDRFLEQVWSTLQRGAVAGAFRLRVDDAHPGLRWIEWGANARSGWFQMPFGDQAQFVTSELFFRVGGFPNWPLMEDYELCRRLRTHGRILLAPAAVSTSSRRWRNLGLWRTTLLNQVCIAAFRLGVSPERLADWYTAQRRRRSIAKSP